MTQRTLGNLSFVNKKKRLRGEIFFEDMNKAIPWKLFLQSIRRHYREKTGNGRPSYPAELMLRIYFLQQWFHLSDKGMEEALYDTHSLRAFAACSSFGENCSGCNVTPLIATALPPFRNSNFQETSAARPRDQGNAQKTTPERSAGGVFWAFP